MRSRARFELAITVIVQKNKIILFSKSADIQLKLFLSKARSLTARKLPLIRLLPDRRKGHLRVKVSFSSLRAEIAHATVQMCKGRFVGNYTIIHQGPLNKNIKYRSQKGLRVRETSFPGIRPHLILSLLPPTPFSPETNGRDPISLHLSTPAAVDRGGENFKEWIHLINAYRVLIYSLLGNRGFARTDGFIDYRLWAARCIRRARPTGFRPSIERNT